MPCIVVMVLNEDGRQNYFDGIWSSSQCKSGQFICSKRGDFYLLSTTGLNFESSVCKASFMFLLLAAAAISARDQKHKNQPQDEQGLQ